MSHLSVNTSSIPEYELLTRSTLLGNYSNSTAYTTLEEDTNTEPNYLSLLLFILVLFTVFGNILVVIAISRFRKLRTVTNQMILSLAIADLLIGVTVMPFNISNDVLEYWPYGQAMCHVWHSLDVLGSTASILNLCMISLDRYWAVTNPIAYPRLMSKRRGFICISVVWLCSAVISFPVIAWWEKVDEVFPNECRFTEDTVYLVLSSMISFYIPVLVMVVVYTKIFVVIKAQSKQYALASDCATRRMSGCHLRAHRGGITRKGSDIVLTNLNGAPLLKTSHQSQTKLNGLTIENQGYTSGQVSVKSSVNDNDYESGHLKRLMNRVNIVSSKKSVPSMSNEFRVARTLGLVLGIFLICWLPFFLCNFLYAVCKTCIENEVIVFKVITWLGHVNSAINPVIYALSMKNMRAAFVKILCCCKRERPSSLATHFLNGTFSVAAAPAHLQPRQSFTNFEIK